MYFHEYFADFDKDFSVLDESGTYNDLELYDLDPKLNLPLTALLRKVSIFYRIGKKYSASSKCVQKNISRMTRVKILEFSI